jgi:hypothetical protein
MQLRPMQTDSAATTSGSPAQAQLTGEARLVRPRLDLGDAATELLAIVGYITAIDGPLQPAPDSTDPPSPWHERALLKASERLDVLDAYLRGRVAFFVGGRDSGYGPFDKELELAAIALDDCRAATSVVEALRAGRLPEAWDFEAMGDTALRIYPALEAIRSR